ncbi:CBS domain-containing protein [Streptomyces sp. NPDC058394]|uniref:CBS domain-containing protein n=1 Tax=unclassified Streptomyces TaxID=2593676 RepID=UPI003654C523
MPVLLAAQKMTEMDVGALPMCGIDDKLRGVLTDRDLMVTVLGRTMTANEVRRLPVTDEPAWSRRVAQADTARTLLDLQVGDLLKALSTDSAVHGPPRSEQPRT